jgi:DNA-binding transcriptional MerR regulator
MDNHLVPENDIPQSGSSGGEDDPDLAAASGSSGPSGSSGSGRRTYRIDELARAAGTTVRNVRAYQDRGLIPPPRREGRAGVYGDGHLARLRLIGSLLERGYTLANIAELLSAWERGQDVGSLLGFETALAARWAPEPTVAKTAGELLADLGLAGAGPGEPGLAGAGPGEAGLAVAGPADVDTGHALSSLVERAVAAGLLERDGDRYKVANPAALEVGALLVRSGVPFDPILAAGAGLREDADRIARRFVDLVDTHVLAPRGDPPAAEDLPALSALVERLRPLAIRVVETELALAMERRIGERFGEHLRKFAAHLGDRRAQLDDGSAPVSDGRSHPGGQGAETRDGEPPETGLPGAAS